MIDEEYERTRRRVIEVGFSPSYWTWPVYQETVEILTREGYDPATVHKVLHDLHDEYEESKQQELERFEIADPELDELLGELIHCAMGDENYYGVRDERLAIWRHIEKNYVRVD